MKKLIVLLLVSISLAAYSQTLPEGVTRTSSPCQLAKGLSAYIYSRDNETIAMIEPEGCNYGPAEGSKKAMFVADFYPNNGKKSFNTNDEAVKWLTSEIESYYKPVVVTKWLKLENAVPKISLSYPDGWSYRAAKDEMTFKYAGSANNKLVVTLNNSELILIIRTPNTGKQSIKQVMETTAMWNRAIDLKNKPASDINIGGKTFKTTENTFAMLMLQKHYWYSDDKEIIYIVSGLLKDQRIRYPGVVSDIIKSIKW